MTKQVHLVGLDFAHDICVDNLALGAGFVTVLPSMILGVDVAKDIDTLSHILPEPLGRIRPGYPQLHTYNGHFARDLRSLLRACVRTALFDDDVVVNPAESTGRDRRDTLPVFALAPGFDLGRNGQMLAGKGSAGRELGEPGKMRDLSLVHGKYRLDQSRHSRSRL